MDHKCIVCSSDTGRTSALCDKCINPQNAQEREHLFSSIFKVFQATAKTDFGSLETTCKSLADSISKIELGFTPTTVFDKDKHLAHIDQIAKSYMQDQPRFNSFIPVTTEPDGNCLYHSIQRLMPTITASTIELRVRTMIEVVNNHETYKTTYSNLIDICEKLPIYCQEVKDKQDAQLWDILGLCDVLRCRIQLMCAKDPPLHQLQNTTFCPINNCQNTTNTIILMWTNTSCENDLLCLDKKFSVNHFVPLLIRDDVETKPEDLNESKEVPSVSAGQTNVDEYYDVSENDTPESWSVEKVTEWLSSIGLTKYIDAFKENEIDGSTLMSNGFDDSTMKELIPPLKLRVTLKNERLKLKSRTQTSTVSTTEESSEMSKFESSSYDNRNKSSPTNDKTNTNTQKPSQFPAARINNKAICPTHGQNQSHNSNVTVNLQDLLKDDSCLHSEQINICYFDSNHFELFKNLSFYLCAYEDTKTSTELDPSFNTIVEDTISEQVLIENIIKFHSLKVYVLDSLKRYHSLMDIIHILPSCFDINIEKFSEQDKKKITNFLSIISRITKSVLLTSTIESFSSESQRYFGNFIKKNDLPVPFAYYTWNQQKDILEYKVNFNIVAEIMCSTIGQYVLHVGSESTMGMGKTSLLQYIFPDKRSEVLTTDGSSVLRNGCIDVLFSSESKSKKNDSHIIFDVHGTMNAFNEDVITSIQEYCSYQILYVTNDDLNTTFLSSVMNYSARTKVKPTIVIIFDPNYDNNYSQENQVIDPFRSKFRFWSQIMWITAPSEQVWNQRDDNKKNKDLIRSKRLMKTFNGLSEYLNKQEHETIVCTSIFSIQSYYINVKNLENFERPGNYRFDVENDLDALFRHLNDKTENLLIATPVSYLDSAIKQCEKELEENWNELLAETQAKKDILQQQRLNIKTINPHTDFFIKLLTKRSYIELLITEKYLEKWRCQFETTLLEELTKVKNKALTYYSRIKQIEERLTSQKDLSQVDKDRTQEELQTAKSKYDEQRILVNNINDKLMNIDLTIGLFCDEIMALYDLSPLLFDPHTIIQDIGKALINLMIRGFAIHMLRGRPLRCQSKLIEESIQLIQTTEKPPLVLTVIGEQSSAKSSLMNATFGCNFRTSSGRCTIGMYMSVVHWKSETIVIFDTEGLLSLEEAGSIFDNQMVTMAVLSSHLVLINHKGEFNSNFKDLIGMSFYAKINIQSPIKPKLFFVLRDQTDLKAKEVFFGQLTKLKEQLQNDSQFLKTSIDNELDIHHGSVYLLPNAFTHEVNSVSNVTQNWRNQLFPNEIIEFRNIIYKNITEAGKPQKYDSFRSTPTTTNSTQVASRPETPSIDPAYENMPQLYTKISSNWRAIDKLGPKLLQCKTLQELSIVEELQAIVYQIIKDTNATFYQEGEKLINETLNLFKTKTISMNRDDLLAQFNSQLNTRVLACISKSQTSFDNQTERSCFTSELKAKVRKLIEPPTRSVQHLLQSSFVENLNIFVQKHRLDDTRKKFLNSIQEQFDQNKCLNSETLKNLIETSFQTVMSQCRTEIQASCETSEKITKRIVGFYNERLYCKQAEKFNENLYNLLSPISTNSADYRSYLEKMNICLWQITEKKLSKSDKITGDFWKDLKSQLQRQTQKPTGNSWAIAKLHLQWFTYNNKEQKNKTIFEEIRNLIVQNFRALSSLINNIKFRSSNPKIIDSLFQTIENMANSTYIQDHSKYLLKPQLYFDLAMFGLNIIIDHAVEIEKSYCQSTVERLTNEMAECKNNSLDQCTAMNDALELGKAVAKTVETEIVNGISHVLKHRIGNEIKKEIAESSFINHEAVQEQAYKESFTDGNGENIIKYVYDINRYFIEFSLRQIKPSANAVINKHTLKFKDLFTEVINKVHGCVQKHTFSSTQELKHQVYEEIVQSCELNPEEFANISLLDIFLLESVICVPITQENEFKQGFRHIKNVFQDIQKRIDDLTEEIKNQVLDMCKQNIVEKLGCQIRCPGCGAKCSKIGPHEEEEVEVWHEPCEKCPKDKCVCEHPKPKSVITHETNHHIAGVFNGWRFHKHRTPFLRLCYQNWTNSGTWVPKKLESNDSEYDYELIYPSAKYYNQYHPAWYNNLKTLSTEGNACEESIPPPDQRRAWMIVRPTLLNHYKSTMIDHEKYDEKLYPHNVDTLPEDFEPKWKDETFD